MDHARPPRPSAGPGAHRCPPRRRPRRAAAVGVRLRGLGPDDGRRAGERGGPRPRPGPPARRHRPHAARQEARDAVPRRHQAARRGRQQPVRPALMPVEEYPQLPPPPQRVGTVPGEVFAAAVNQVAIAAARDETPPVLTGRARRDRRQLAEPRRHRPLPAGAARGRVALRRHQRRAGVPRPGPHPQRDRQEPRRRQRRRDRAVERAGRAARHLRRRPPDHRPAHGRGLPARAPAVPGVLRHHGRRRDRAARRRRAAHGPHRGPGARSGSPSPRTRSSSTPARARTPRPATPSRSRPSTGRACPSGSTPRTSSTACGATNARYVRLAFTQPSKPVLLSGHDTPDASDSRGYTYLLMPTRVAGRADG